ncbi:DUF1573 domain-containing protein [Luteolibacter pohnpeiensis]|uniref:DUF1573 domain-containing protein n=1 Tax=Luteolibacter pohnpeiensis TaxID=454153 RepID=A0A934VUG0_9BACT|nr:DUF1573 domain-containing protein [Luteolibacter pohnpeiensis]MBK1881105.1 DUF1573 domain-containing protein [Luteolibacter pohnpeiensis]
MKVVIASWAALTGVLFAGGLEFAESTKEVTVDPTKETVTVDFNFTNRSDEKLQIEKTDGGCTCVAIKVSGGKTVYAPGESGVLRAIVSLENYTGEVDRPLNVWLKGDHLKTQKQTLDIKIKIPVLVSVEPKTLVWSVGEKPEPKVIKIQMHDTQPIKVESIESSNASFATELKTLKEGTEYELTVTPSSTEKLGELGIFRILTDSRAERYRSIQAYGGIQQKH